MIKNNLEGKIIEQWTVIKELGAGKIKVKCSCGTERIIYKKTLIEGKTKSCGCLKSNYISSKQLIKLDGKRFGEWTVIKDTKPQYVLCRCSCGIEREVQKQALKDGRSTSCGHKMFTDDITGETFWDWYIVKDHKNGQVTAQCKCGIIKINRKHSIVHGISKSCGHSEKLKGMKFGQWEVIQDIENDRKKLCRCSCGTIKKIHPTLLKNGHTRSCGCMLKDYSEVTMLERYGDIASSRINNPRTDWQINTVKNRDNMVKYLVNLEYKPTIYDLHKRLDLCKSRITKLIHNFDLDDYINWYPTMSEPEDEISRYIKDILGYEVINSDRLEIKPLELDIYIPELKTAIEFNGTYWHSSEYKDTEYHQRKSLIALQKGIRLIHVYEYEWNEDKIRILSDLTDKLYNNVTDEDNYNTDFIKLSLDKDDVISYINKGYTIFSIEEPERIMVNNYEIFNSGCIILRKRGK